MVHQFKVAFHLFAKPREAFIGRLRLINAHSEAYVVEEELVFDRANIGKLGPHVSLTLLHPLLQHAQVFRMHLRWIAVVNGLDRRHARACVAAHDARHHTATAARDGTSSSWPVVVACAVLPELLHGAIAAPEL